MGDMAAVWNDFLIPKQQQALEEHTSLCLALSDNFNDAIDWHSLQTSLRNILLHQIGTLQELDFGAGGLPATLVANIEYYHVYHPFHIYQSARNIKTLIKWEAKGSIPQKKGVIFWEKNVNSEGGGLNWIS